MRMTLAFLQQKLDEYKQTQGFRLKPDGKGVTALKNIAKNYSLINEPIRTFEIIKVLLNDATGPKGELYQKLREHDSISAPFQLMRKLKQQDLFTFGNLTSVLVPTLNGHSAPLATKILKIWELLSPRMQTQNTYTTLISNDSRLDMPFLETRTKRINNEHDLDAFLSECYLHTYKMTFGTAIVTDDVGDDLPTHVNSSATKSHVIDHLFNNLPRELRTKTNFRTLFLLPVKEDVSQNISYLYSFIRTPKEPDKIQALLDEILSIGKTDKKLLENIYTIFYRLLPDEMRTPENFNLLNNNFNVEVVTYLATLLPQNLLTQANFELIINNQSAISNFMHRARDAKNEVHVILDRLPRHGYSQNIFNLILAITQAPAATRQNAIDRLRGAVDQRLEELVGEGNRQRGALNVAQSTHTASVHKSVSESAIKLKKRYGNKITTDRQLNAVISKFSEFVKKVNLDSLNKYEGDPKDAPTEPISELMLKTAKNAIKWLSNPTTAFVDQQSQVSTRELMSFIWLGIHDDATRLGNLQDAYRKVITALYDIQRGYNLDEHFKEKETGTADRAICTAGTFNKLMEILWGLHKDVELKYITSEFASLKLQKLAPEVANFYLQDLLSTDSNKERIAALNKILSPAAADFYLKKIDINNDRNNAAEIISLVAKKGIIPIWQKIKPVIEEQIFDEYGSLYKNDKNDLKFIDFVASGKDVNLDKGFISKLLAKTQTHDEKEETKEEYKPDKIILRTSTSRRSSFFVQPSNHALHEEEKTQADSKSLSDWEDTFKKTLQEQIISVENTDDKTAHTKLKILNNLLEKYPLNGIASVAIFERNLSNTVNAIKENGESRHDLSSTYSDCLNTLQKSLESITSIKLDMEKNDPDATESDDNEQKLTR